MPDAAPDATLTARDLRIAVGRLARRIRQIFATADAASDATFTELAVLARLEREGPATSAALADSERVSPQAVGTVLAALHQQGLVTRAPDPADGRRVVTAISAAGLETLEGRTQVVTDALARVLGDAFDTGELRQVAAVLPLLERLADRL